MAEFGRHVRFITKAEGLEDIRRMLAHAERRALDLSPVLAGDVNDLTQQFFKTVFESEGAVLGKKWASLTLDTRIRKAKRGYADTKILQMTGAGAASLVSETGDSLVVVRKHAYERSTRIGYMHAHQTGYVVERWGHQVLDPPREVPARPWMPKRLPDSLVKKYANAIAAHIIEIGGRSFSIRTPSGTQNFR